MAEGAEGAFPQLTSSKSRIDRAGKRIRHRVRNGQEPLAEDISVLAEFRGWHLPTTLTLQQEITGLLHEGTALTQEILPITSRWKTPEAIRAKLCRSSTALSRMQDIAGVRIVVPTLEIQDLLVGIVLDFFDYCSPRPPKDTRAAADFTGYRAVHIIITLDERLAEIQVRTRNQDVWAQIIEDVDARMSWDLKHGDGPAAEWTAWFQDLSDEYRKSDLGLPFTLPPSPYDEEQGAE